VGPSVVPRRAIVVQLAAVTLLILSFIWYWRHTFRGSTALFAVLLIALLVYSHRTRRDSWRGLGFRVDTALEAAKILVPAGLLAIGITALVAAGSDGRSLPSAANVFASIAKLIAFGTAQQYVLLGFYYRGIEALVPSPLARVAATAAVFAAFHFPNPFLMAVTFAAALVAAFVYRRAPNLWVTGIVHGVVSFTLYVFLPTTLTHGLRVGPGY
jgi:membrane protease YdiL (CAAX protease family)